MLTQPYVNKGADKEGESEGVFQMICRPICGISVGTMEIDDPSGISRAYSVLLCEIGYVVGV